MSVPDPPELRGEARAAVQYRDGHLQIIASAGSGKTEVVSQRVADLLAEGFLPQSIVAFTFTERSAGSLKSRIEKRVAARLGEKYLDRLNGLFVGTIHSYCFQILQQHVARYETYDVLDEHRLTAFLTREAWSIGLKNLEGKLFKSIRAFAPNLDVVENELLEPSQLEDPFREIYERYLSVLEDNRFLTYGQIIARAVKELADPETFEQVHAPLRHLIVDEYQDINPGQERLIKRLAEPPVHLCVVGDDDQSIYQWRGSDVSNIIDFEKRYPDVRQFRIEENRRSRPAIIKAGNLFGANIEGRLPKRMLEHRSGSGRAEVVCWSGETPEDEAALIARTIRSAHDDLGYAYKDIAILCRGRVSFPTIKEALDAEGVPVQPGGRTNLFLQDDAEIFGRTICWLVGFDWRKGEWGWDAEEITLEDLITRYRVSYRLSTARTTQARDRLLAWRGKVDDPTASANLVRDFYDLLGDLGVEEWDLSDPWTVNRLGTLARCSQVLVDHEQTRRRAQPDHTSPGDIKGGRDRGRKYYEWLAIYLQNWATGAYEDFEGEEDVELDAVDLTTIHQAKGLEWPIVFVPTLKKGRFPTSSTGRAGNWHVPRALFNPARYEGSENDERRLFYVAMTRARDFLSLSTFERMKKGANPSAFLLEVAEGSVKKISGLPRPPDPEVAEGEPEVLEITFSDLAAYLECGLSYRLRRQIGFQPPLVPELGYGKAVHHVLRKVADHVRRYRAKPNPKQLDRIFDDEFYLPAANKPGYRQMKDRARKLVDRYVGEWEADLHRVWAVERPFELHLGDATVSGRADVILTEGNGGPDRYSIVDYKTAADGHSSHDFQLQVYTDAGRREGLDVESAFVHDLKQASRAAVPVASSDIESAEDRVKELVRGLRSKDYVPKPGVICARCDVRAICRYRAP